MKLLVYIVVFKDYSIAVATSFDVLAQKYSDNPDVVQIMEMTIETEVSVMSLSEAMLGAGILK